MPSLFEGTNLGLLKTPFETWVEAMKATEGLGANASRSMAAGMQARSDKEKLDFQKQQAAQELERTQAIQNSISSIMGDVEKADTIQGKLDALQSDKAKALWGNPDGRAALGKVTEYIGQISRIQGSLNASKTANRLANWNNDMINFGLTAAAKKNGPGDPIYDKVAKDVREYHALQMANRRNVPQSKIDFNRIEGLGNGMLNEAKWDSYLTSLGGMPVKSSTAYGASGGDATAVTYGDPSATGSTAAMKNAEAYMKFYNQAQQALADDDIESYNVFTRMANMLGRTNYSHLTKEQQIQYERNLKFIYDSWLDESEMEKQIGILNRKFGVEPPGLPTQVEPPGLPTQPAGTISDPNNPLDLKIPNAIKPTGSPTTPGLQPTSYLPDGTPIIDTKNGPLIIAPQIVNAPIP